MRQIGTLPDQARAERFRDWLVSRDITADVELEEGTWLVWVYEEDQLEEARKELAAFQADPDDSRYATAAEAVRQLRRVELRRTERRRVVKPRRSIGVAWVNTPLDRCRVTIVLILVSLVVTALSASGLKKGTLEFEQRYEPVLVRATIVPFELIPDNMIRFPRRPGFEVLLQAECWRLVTPIFIHFSILHILFNMLWLRLLGGAIEARRGKLKYVAMVLLIAVISNVAEWVIDPNPLSGGMSGVVYGLFGYAWMKERYDPADGVGLPPRTVLWMLGWFVLCWTGAVGPIGNWAHTFGLLSGMLIGLLPIFFRNAKANLRARRD